MAEGVYRALLIGNSTFPEDPHNLFTLNGPINDLVYLHEALIDRAVGLFEPAHIRLLPEQNKHEVTTAIELFFRSAGREDTLLLFYSGHGKADEEDNLFLCARDTRTDLIQSTGISDQEIDRMIRASPTRAVVIVLDCCHSGAFKSGGLPNKLKGSGRFLLTSSRRGEPSQDADHPSATSAFTRHLVNALRCGQDNDGDGYLSVNDVYDHVLTNLRAETKQIPQRHFDRAAVGDVALARRNKADNVAPPDVDADTLPVLAVSTELIELRDVSVDETLPVEIVDVFNEGGGELSWSATSNVDWIRVEQRDSWCELTLTPQPGVNRGAIRIRDAGRGGSKTVRVLIEVRRQLDPPGLLVEPLSLDFGALRVGSDCPPRTLLINNTGTGTLQARVEASDPWLHVEQTADVVTVFVDTTLPAVHVGEVRVHSLGGNQTVPVRAVVERGPVLETSRAELDFGRAVVGERLTSEVAVRNTGSGDLDWSIDVGALGDDFFSVTRKTDSISVSLTVQPDVHEGWIWIRGNGGEARIGVRTEGVIRQEGIPPWAWVVGLAATAVFALALVFPWDTEGHSWIHRNFIGVGNASWFANLLSAVSPLALVVGTITGLALLYRPPTRPLGAGLLIGIGLAATGKYLGLLLWLASFSAGDRAESVAIIMLAAVAGCALAATGGWLARRAPLDRLRSKSELRALHVLVLAGVVLTVIGCAIPFNRGSDELPPRAILPVHGARADGWLALDQAATLLAALVAVRVARVSRQVAGGMLIAVGIASALLWLRYIGVPLTQRNDKGSGGLGGFVGLAGSLALGAAGAFLIWTRQDVK